MLKSHRENVWEGLEPVTDEFCANQQTVSAVGNAGRDGRRGRGRWGHGKARVGVRWGPGAAHSERRPPNGQTRKIQIEGSPSSKVAQTA